MTKVWVFNSSLKEDGYTPGFVHWIAAVFTAASLWIIDYVIKVHTGLYLKGYIWYFVNISILLYVKQNKKQKNNKRIW